MVHQNVLHASERSKGQVPQANSTVAVVEEEADSYDGLLVFVGD